MTSRSTRVVIVDDSATRRAALQRLLGSAAHVEVVGTAVDPESALAAVETLDPAVVTMDLEMPGGGGEEAIARIMASHPVPILVLSAHATGLEASRAMDALGAGALEIFPWPAVWDEHVTADLVRHIRALDSAVVLHHWRGGRAAPRPVAPPGARKTIGIAASTGGPPALATLLEGLRLVATPILVVQHLHPEFLDSFINWLARAAGTRVVEADDGMATEPGVVYVGPSGFHLRVGDRGLLSLSRRPSGLHMPSATELFQSLATHVGSKAVGVILTGMGEDGVTGLAALRRAGGLTIAQDEASSAVWGMPGAAVRRGAAQRVLPLRDIASAVAGRVGRAR